MNGNILVQHLTFTDFGGNELTGFLAEVIEALGSYFELKMSHRTLDKELGSGKDVGSKWFLRSICAKLTGAREE